MLKFRLIVGLQTLMVGALLLSACGATPAELTPTVTINPDEIRTQAVGTFAADLTLTAFAAPTNTPAATITPLATFTAGPTAAAVGTAPVAGSTASCYGMSFVSEPSREPSPAASRTTCTVAGYNRKPPAAPMVRLEKTPGVRRSEEQARQLAEAVHHGRARKPQRKALTRERPGHAHEGQPLALGDLAVVKRVAHEQHVFAAEAEPPRPDAKAGRPVQLLERRGPSPDHPVSVSCLESHYLKCLLARVR